MPLVGAEYSLEIVAVALLGSGKCSVEGNNPRGAQVGKGMGRAPGTVV